MAARAAVDVGATSQIERQQVGLDYDDGVADADLLMARGATGSAHTLALTTHAASPCPKERRPRGDVGDVVDRARR